LHKAYTNSQKNTYNMMPIKMTIIPDIYDLPFKFIKKENKGDPWGTAPYSRSLRVKGLVQNTLVLVIGVCWK